MESKLQARVVTYLRKKGWYVVKITRCNRAGFPDLMAMHAKGIVEFLEIKDKGKHAEPLQRLRHSELLQLGFNTHVVDSWAVFKEITIFK